MAEQKAKAGKVGSYKPWNLSWTTAATRSSRLKIALSRMCASVLVPVTVALGTAWKTNISPAILHFEENLTSKIQAQINGSNI